MITIRDIARRAQVSTAAVSYVLNQRGGAITIGDETKKRILRIAKELNYQPNIVAQSLARRKSRIIGLMLPDITQPFFTQIIKGVEHSAAEKGYSVIICDTEEKVEKERLHFDILSRRWVDGLIYSGPMDETNPAQISKIAGDIPVVGIDREVNGQFFYSICADNKAGGYSATKYLIELGHRRIGVVCGPLEARHSSNFGARVEGYREALAEYKIPFEPSLLAGGSSLQVESGMKGAGKLFSLPEKPTAIFAVTDVLAIGVLKQARQIGLRVPDDISLIGFDDIPMASLVDPPLTTIAQSGYKMGALAVEMVTSAISEKGLLEKRRLLKVKLVERESCQKRRRPMKH